MVIELHARVSSGLSSLVCDGWGEQRQSGQNEEEISLEQAAVAAAPACDTTENQQAGSLLGGGIPCERTKSLTALSPSRPGGVTGRPNRQRHWGRLGVDGGDDGWQRHVCSSWDAKPSKLISKTQPRTAAG